MPSSRRAASERAGSASAARWASRSRRSSSRRWVTFAPTVDSVRSSATQCGSICGVTAMIEALMQDAVEARGVAEKAVARAVREARAAHWSWDKISTALGGTPNGETLRRNFGAEDPLRVSPRSRSSSTPPPAAI